MTYCKKELLEYWDNIEVESMYDKYLLTEEIELIKSKLRSGTKILDAGCGEGEATFEYAKIDGIKIIAADFSGTRLKKAHERLVNSENVSVMKIDFSGDYELNEDFDIIISQRFLINLLDWDLQKKVIKDFYKHLKKGGNLLLLEGSLDGSEQLNNLRSLFKLEPINIKWHNLFFRTNELENYVETLGFKLIEKDGLGDFFFLTRGIRPYFEKELNWENPFNLISASKEIKSLLNLKERFSRIVLWNLQKI